MTTLEGSRYWVIKIFDHSKDCLQMQIALCIMPICDYVCGFVTFACYSVSGLICVL